VQSGFVSDHTDPDDNGVTAQPAGGEREPPGHQETTPSRPALRKALAAARDRFERSIAQDVVCELRALDFSNQAMLFGAGLLISLLPFFILLSAFANARVDDDLALRLGLDHRASGIVTQLFISSPARLNVATATSLLFLTAGALTVAKSLQQIYEKAFHQDHRGLRDLYRLVIWIGAVCVAVTLESLGGRAARNLAGGVVLAELVTLVVMAPFFWWTMHFLLAGRIPWRRLLPSAIATAIFFAGLGIFSRIYFSATIISDSKTYGTIGAVFSIMSWLIAIGAVIILGAVAGTVWASRRANTSWRLGPDRASSSPISEPPDLLCARSQRAPALAH
jgi:membrane protein